LTAPTISHHVKVLREAGLVECERRGTWVYYWVAPGAMAQFAGLFGKDSALPLQPDTPEPWMDRRDPAGVARMRRDVQPGDLEPEMHVTAERTLPEEPHRLAAGQRDAGVAGEFGRDLDRGIARPHDDHPLARVRRGVAVLGSMQHRPGEVLQARHGGPVRPSEPAGRRDHRAGGQHLAVVEPHGELGTLRPHPGDAPARADVGVQPRRVPQQIVHDLVPVRIAVGARR
jgi:hypothetical protein